MELDAIVTTEQTPTETGPPEDYAAYEAYMAARDTGKHHEPIAPAASASTQQPPSESSEAIAEDGQTAEASEAAETSTEQESEVEVEQEEPVEQEEAQQSGKDTRLARRMRQLTGTIARLEARLAESEQQTGAEAEESDEEVASSTEVEPAQQTPSTLKRPKLSEFEDIEDKSAWDQYEEALDAYFDAKQANALQKAIADHKAELAQTQQEGQARAAKAAADASWNTAASRWPNYNEVVSNPEVKISAAMEQVMRTDPTKGTEIAYYLGQHPDESLAIANETLANSEGEWTQALIRAGMLLGEVKAKLAPPAKGATANLPPAARAAAAATATPKPPAPNPPTKKVTTANRPPTQIRAGVAPPAVNVLDDNDAADYAKWERAREAQLKRK